jgi:hypothetical protein
MDGPAGLRGPLESSFHLTCMHRVLVTAQSFASAPLARCFPPARRCLFPVDTPDGCPCSCACVCVCASVCSVYSPGGVWASRVCVRVWPLSVSLVGLVEGYAADVRSAGCRERCASKMCYVMLCYVMGRRAAGSAGAARSELRERRVCVDAALRADAWRAGHLGKNGGGYWASVRDAWRCAAHPASSQRAHR